jgi:uncharacterized protein (TIGR03435 family)
MNRLPFLIALLIAAPLFAEGPSFEVATVKKADEPQPGKPVFFGRRGGPGTDDPGRITWSNVNLRTLLTTAYDVKPYQITGADWMDSERFEIVAKVPAGATKEQVNVMWQNLLADRFGVLLHHSSKVMQAYEMEAVKGGVKLKPATLDPKSTASQVPSGPPQRDKNGVPQFTSPGIFMMMTMGPTGPAARLIGRAQTIEQLTVSLSNQLNHPVVDKTGLTGQYDFVLEFTPDSRGGLPGMGPMPLPIPADPSQSQNAAEPGGTTLVAALQQQLGLKLTSTKAPVDMIIIDKAEKAPTEN